MVKKFFLAVVLLAAASLWAQDQGGLRAGPMNGYATQRATVIWLQTRGADTVRIRYWWTNHPKDSARLTDPVITRKTDDFTAHIPVTHLEPGRKYFYEVLVNGRKVALPHPPVFQTQPLWQWRTDPPEFSVALGSCFYVNDPPYDRPGNAYGGNVEILQSIAGKHPDVMVWLGDNVYLREADFGDPAMLAYRYAHTRRVPQLQPLLSTAHHYAIWDDHDYGPNDADRSYVLKGVALDIFRRYWANPSYGLPGVPGVFTQFTWGDVDFFLLDDRYYRTPNRVPDTDPQKTMWGKEQLEWLLDALTYSKAPFKLVMNGNQVMNAATRYESLAAHFPAEFEYLIKEIRRRKISGVVFVSGDRHLTELMRYQPEGAYPLYELTVSPLTSRWANRKEKNPRRVAGTLVLQRNFAVLRFSGPRKDRKMTVTVYDVQGNRLWQRVIAAGELRYPRKKNKKGEH